MIDRIAFIYLIDRQLMCTRSRGKDTYYIPGGKREGNETDIETLVREVKEELCVDIIESTVQLYGVFQTQAHGKNKGTFVQNTCYTAEFVGAPRADSEIAEIVWLHFSDINQVSPVDQLIFQDLHTKGLLT